MSKGYTLSSKSMSALQGIPNLATKADCSGMIVQLSFPTSGKTATPHVMIDDAVSGERLANWWPSTGTTFSDGKRGFAEDWSVVLEMAKSVRLSK